MKTIISNGRKLRIEIPKFVKGIRKRMAGIGKELTKPNKRIGKKFSRSKTKIIGKNYNSGIGCKSVKSSNENDNSNGDNRNHWTICLYYSKEIIIVITFLISVCSLVGWRYGLEGLTNWVEGFVSMKPASAILILLTCFVCVTILIKHKLTKRINDFFVALIGSWILGSVAILLMLNILSYYIQVNKYFEVFLLPDDEPYAGISLIPSLVALFVFFLISCICFIYTWNTVHCVLRIKVLSVIIFFIGLSAVIGNLTGQEYLYFYFGDKWAGMALNTGFCFTLFGLFFNIVSNELKTNYLKK